MDVSGSMGDEQKELVRLTAFWLDAWLRRHYRGLATRYLVHDVAAREVDRDAFFRTRESGGTRISSAYQLAARIVERDYPPDAWNSYVFHFSDGDNEGGEDTARCVELLAGPAPPGRSTSSPTARSAPPEAAGQHLEALRAGLGDRPEVVLAQPAGPRRHRPLPARLPGDRPVSACRPHGRLPAHLEALSVRIEGWARGFGLDPWETVFEVLDWDELNMVAAYGGFPTRYPHWRFGMEYERLSKGHAYGLSRIYELVINNRPAYAYLMRSNLDVDQKLVMAHVYGHVDFFRHNFMFRPTHRKMMDEMANHATRVRRHQDRVGVEAVEDFVDRCLTLENLID